VSAGEGQGFAQQQSKWDRRDWGGSFDARKEKKHPTNDCEMVQRKKYQNSVLL
jgi:hypothetical protein